MKMKRRRGLALLLTLCLLIGNIAFAEELPAQSSEPAISEAAPVQNREIRPAENEAEPPEKNEAEAPEGNVKNARAEQEEALEVSPEHAPEALREGAPEEGRYLLDISVSRRESVYDNIQGAYLQYWRKQPEPNPVFNTEEFDFRSFDIEYTLNIEWNGKQQKQKMHFENYTLSPTIHFENIEVPYNEIDVDYYTREGEDWVEPYALEYDIDLSIEDGKLILDVPKLQPTPESSVVIKGDEHLL